MDGGHQKSKITYQGRAFQENHSMFGVMSGVVADNMIYHTDCDISQSLSRLSDGIISSNIILNNARYTKSKKS